jgi:hypothetical protein
MLPANVLAVPSPERDKKLATEAASGKSVRDVQPALAIKTTSRTEALFIDEDVWLRLTLFGFGDVDGDGNEDVIVEARSGAAKGSWSSGTLWVFTRTAPSGMLKVVQRS